MFSLPSNDSHASYSVSLQLARAQRPFADGELVKTCATEMANAFGNLKLGESFQTVPLSRVTVQRRIVAMGEQVEKAVKKLVRDCVYYSFCLDESTDQADVSQPLIFVRLVQEIFSVHEELLAVHALHGSTKGADLFEALKKSIDEVGGFTKCTSATADGAPALMGKKAGVAGRLRLEGFKGPIFHCIIHQEALCGKSLKQQDTFKVVVKVINMLRGGNKSLLHRDLQTFLEENEAEYGDLLLYNPVRWLSAGGCLRRFFGLRKEIPEFLKNHVSADTTELESKLESTDFLKELAFLADITEHLNGLNLNLQGKNQLISDLIGHVNGFRNKLKLFIATLRVNNLTHFKTCAKLSEESDEENKPQFTEFVENLNDISSEFQERFADFDTLESSILLFSSPLTTEIADQDPGIALELCDLQADPFFKTRREIGADLFKLLPQKRFPLLRDFGLKMVSMFGSTYRCEATFSIMNNIKTNMRNRLTDESLRHVLRLAVTQIDIDIQSLVKEAEHPQLSH